MSPLRDGREHRVTEAELQDAIAGMARALRWRVAHHRPARTEKGWRTAWQYDGKGLPDLLMVRGRRRVVAELKGERGKLEHEQAVWLEALDATAAECHVWRPSDWISGRVEAVLR